MNQQRSIFHWMKRRTSKNDVSCYQSKHVQQFNESLRKHCKKYGTIIVDDDTDTDDAATTDNNTTNPTTNSVKETTASNNKTTSAAMIDNNDVVVSDNDIWIEFIYYTKNTHRLVHYYCSIRTQRIILHSPPTGAGIIIFANELDNIIQKFPFLEHHIATNVPKLSKELIVQQMERPHTNKDILESIGIIRNTKTKTKTKDNNSKSCPLLRKLFNYTNRKNDVKKETIIIDDIDDNNNDEDDHDNNSNSTISSIETTRAENMSASVVTTTTIAEV